ncbi:MAG: NAD(P)-dependent alcohol dehydrogenase [Anaerolineales bacterium]|nr:NAD(P)-dependent alcohol dehydrogenase [Anaerolineales bacterium]
MKAFVCRKNGRPILATLEDVPKPVPKENEALVEIFASSVTYNNMLLVNSKLFPLRLLLGDAMKLNSAIPGDDIAGRIEAVGKGVTRFKPGDEVYGNLFSCGKGGYAEYACAPANVLAHKPDNISFEEAAAVPEAATVALLGLRDNGRIQPGQKVLIYGASGGIGTFAVQIAKVCGAEVTGVCSTRNVAMINSLGADHVIDYKKQDFTKSGQLYDLIFAVRNTRSVYAVKRALNPKGIYVSAGSGSPMRLFQEMVIGPRIFQKEGKEIRVIYPKLNQEDLVFIKELIETGKVKPVIDKCFPLSEVNQAFRYYSKGHAQGRVVITVKS